MKILHNGKLKNSLKSENYEVCLHMMNNQLTSTCLSSHKSFLISDNKVDMSTCGQ